MDFEQRAFREVRDIAVAQYDLLDEHTVRTEEQNCLFDAFIISHQGEFGTINPFRLGRTSMVYVEWNEINTGFGESAFLLRTLAGILNVKFTEQGSLFFMEENLFVASSISSYRLVVLGSTF